MHTVQHNTRKRYGCFSFTINSGALTFYIFAFTNHRFFFNSFYQMHLCMPRRAIFICIYLSVSILCLCVFHFLLQLADFTSGFIKLNWHHRDILQCIECIPPTKRGIHCQQIFAINVAISLVTSDDSEEDDKRSGVLRSYPVKVPLYLCLFFNCLFLQTTNILKRKSKRNLALLLFDIL